MALAGALRLLGWVGSQAMPGQHGKEKLPLQSCSDRDFWQTALLAWGRPGRLGAAPAPGLR